MPSCAKRAVLASAALPVLAAGATVVLFTPFARRTIDPHHDGIMLKPALDLLAGQTLFRDTFSQYGIGIPYLQAAALGVLGERLLALKLATVGAYAIGAAFLVDAWRRLLPPGLTLLAFAIWLVLPGFYSMYFPFQPWSSAWAISFQAIALDTLVCMLLGRAAVPMGVVCGAACALVFLCRQPVGVVTSAAAVLALATAAWQERDPWPARRALLACVASLAIVLGATGVVLVASGTLGDWYFQTVAWPRYWAMDPGRSVSSQVFGSLVHFPRLTLPWVAWVVLALLGSRRLGSPLDRRRLGVLVAALAAGAVACLMPVMLRFGTMIAWTIAIPAALVSLGAGTAWRILVGAPAVQDFAVFGATAVGLASWLQYFPNPCPQHTFWSATPAVGLAVYAAWRASGSRTRATAVVLSLAMMPTLVATVPAAYRKLAGPWTRLDDAGVLSGMLVRPAEAAEWRALLAAIDAEVRRRPEVPMLVEGRDALFATLTHDRRNPGPFYVDWDWPKTAVALEDERTRFLSATRPLVFVQRPVRSPLRERLDDAGYTEVFRGNFGQLLVPPAEKARGPSPEDAGH